MKETRIDSPATELDGFMPAFQFHEYHQIRVAAPPAAAYRAVKNVTADEIRFFRMLTWIRRFGRNIPEGILHVGKNKAVLQVALQTSFCLLAEQADREIVLGTVLLHPKDWREHEGVGAQNWGELRRTGFALAAMNFCIVGEKHGGCVVSTETRVYAGDAGSARKFALYWRIIYPGSALIRRMWLRALKRRAERGQP